jgi:hypothetical protein
MGRTGWNNNTGKKERKQQQKIDKKQKYRTAIIFVCSFVLFSFG